MSTYKELNDIFKERFHRDFPRATLSNWVKQKRIRVSKEGRYYNYNLDDFIKEIEKPDFVLKSNAKKENPKNYINKTVGHLFIKGIVPKEDKKEPDYLGTLMYCDCLLCGAKNIQVRFSYLTPNGNYHQNSCGCDRKKQTFLSSTKMNIEEDFLSQFDDFDKFLFLHKQLTNIKGKSVTDYDLEEYKKDILWFYNQIQFNLVYNFWKNSNKNNTYYDWSKPSIDHIIPKSKGGKNNIENLHFVTVFENLAKRDMTWDEWIKFKKETNTTSDYFIDNILLKDIRREGDEE